LSAELTARAQTFLNLTIQLVSSLKELDCAIGATAKLVPINWIQRSARNPLVNLH
jgi:hypothetical protein